MNGRILLDTNVVVALFAGDPAVQRRIAAASEVHVSSAVAGELYYGAEKSTRVQANVARVDAFLQGVSVLPVDATTALTYGRVKNALRAKGTPIPENDIWIAAAAMQHGLILLSRDAHFQQVAGLQLEKI